MEAGNSKVEAESICNLDYIYQRLHIRQMANTSQCMVHSADSILLLSVLEYDLGTEVQLLNVKEKRKRGIEVVLLNDWNPALIKKQLFAAVSLFWPLDLLKNDVCALSSNEMLPWKGEKNVFLTRVLHWLFLLGDICLIVNNRTTFPHFDDIFTLLTLIIIIFCTLVGEHSDCCYPGSE